MLRMGWRCLPLFKGGMLNVTDGMALSFPFSKGGCLMLRMGWGCFPLFKGGMLNVADGMALSSPFQRGDVECYGWDGVVFPFFKGGIGIASVMVRNYQPRIPFFLKWG